MEENTDLKVFKYIVKSICDPLSVKNNENYKYILYQIKKNILEQDPKSYEDVLELYNRIAYGIKLMLFYVEAKELYKRLTSISYHAVVGNKGIAISEYTELLRKLASIGIMTKYTEVNTKVDAVVSKNTEMTVQDNTMETEKVGFQKEKVA